MRPSFLGVDLKVEHAFQLQRELRQISDEWGRAHPLVPQLRTAEEGWHEWTVVAPAEEPPPRLGVLCGAIAYQLRSALDQANWALVADDGGRPTVDTMFPICIDPAKWPNQRRSRLRGMSEHAKDAIESAQPFKQNPQQPRADLLALLDEIGKVDKHRLLVPTATVLGQRNLHVRVVSDTTAFDAQAEPVTLAGQRLGKEPLVIFRARALVAGTDVVDLSARLYLMEATLLPDVAFVTSAPYAILCDVKALRFIAQHVAAVIRLLDSVG